MFNKAHRDLQEHRAAVYAAAALGLLFFHMLWYVNFFLAESLAGTYFLFVIPVLAAFYLYFRGLRDGWEIRLTLAFSLWFWITRILNGDAALVRENYLVLDSLMMTVFLSVGLVLKERGKRVCLNVVSAAAGGFFFLLGLLGLYVYVTRATIANPLTEALTIVRRSGNMYRLTLLGVNPNTTALWFYFSACLMAYQFFACKNKWWRVPIVLNTLVDYFAVAACGSRNVKLAFTLSLALLLCIAAAQALRSKSRGLRALILVLVVLASLPLCYKGFDAATGLMGHAYETRAAAQKTGEEARYAVLPLSAEGRGEASALSSYSDPRGIFEDSGRLKIYEAALESLRQQPQRLWKGCLFEDRMTVADEVLNRQFPSFHNCFLDVLNLTGIPGLLLLLGFLLLLLWRMGKLLFSKSSAVGLAEKMLVLPLVGAMQYELFEPLLFFCYDFRALFTFLMAGFVISYSRE